MAKNKVSQNTEADSQYLFKIVGYLIMGCFWIRILVDSTTQIPIPAGFIVGIILATHERFQIDRKIEYAVLLVSMFIGFWLPIGIYISL